MGCGLQLLAMVELAWHKGSSEQPLSLCVPGTASPAAEERGRCQPGARARHSWYCHAQG